MKIINSLFFAIVLHLPCYLSAQPNIDGLKLMEMQQYKGARVVFIHSIQAHNQAIDWFYLGKIYTIQGLSDSAKYCFSQIVHADPKHNLVLLAEAINELAGGNEKEALSLLDKAQKTALSSKDIATLVEIASVRYQTGDTSAWKIPLNLASGIDTKNVKPYLAAAGIYIMMGEKYKQQSYLGLASGRYEQALYNDPDNLAAGTGEAGIFMTGRNYSEAEVYLEKVLSKDSNYIPALKLSGDLSYTLGNYEKASRLYGMYMSISEYTVKDQLKYITILFFNKEFAKANQLISSLLVNEPSNAVLLRLSGYTSYELGKYTEGLDALKKFFNLRSVADTNKIIPTDYEYAGKLYARTGNDSLAIVFLKKAIEMDPSRSGLFEDISRSFEKQKKYLPAVEYYDRLIISENSNVTSAIYFSKGKDLLNLANDGASDSMHRTYYLSRADTAFRKVIEISPNSHLGYLWHARVISALDPETIRGLAKVDYEKTIGILEQKPDKEKYNSDLIEAYRYMAYYTYLQYEEALSSKNTIAKEETKTASLSYWQKILILDPENDVAKKAIKAIK